MHRLIELLLLLFLCSQAPCSKSRPAAGSPRTIVQAPVGSDALLPCVGAGNHDNAYLGWRHVGATRRSNKMLSNGSLLVENVSDVDAGDYVCMVELPGEAGRDIAHVELVVIAPPPPVSGLEARANANFATISWSNPSRDRGVLDGFRISYSVASANLDWIEPAYLREIHPSSQIIDIYHLAPNTPYIVRMEAFNGAGSSRPVTVAFRTASAGKHSQSNCNILGMKPSRGGDHRWVWIFAAGTVVCGILMAFAIPLCTARYRGLSRAKVIRSVPGAIENPDVLSETIELIPNIVVNPGFESEAAQKSLVGEE